MDFDPYETLGVGRMAGPAAVKAAYRERVRDAHPDRGGDPQAFMAIVRAFGILSDPDARRLYDDAGVVDEAAVAAYRREVAAILVDMFDAAVASASATGLSLERVDFVAQMTAAVRSGIGDAKADEARADRDITALGALGRRITRKGEGLNLFAERIEMQIARRDEDRRKARRRLMILDTALVELGNYASEVELIAALETAAPG